MTKENRFGNYVDACELESEAEGQGRVDEPIETPHVAAITLAGEAFPATPTRSSRNSKPKAQSE